MIKKNTQSHKVKEGEKNFLDLLFNVAETRLPSKFVEISSSLCVVLLTNQPTNMEEVIITQ